MVAASNCGADTMYGDGVEYWFRVNGVLHSLTAAGPGETQSSGKLCLSCEKHSR
eukprot:SAG31_NODE_159_length_21911_cov_12.220750_22_plen_54_part_00